MKELLEGNFRLLITEVVQCASEARELLIKRDGAKSRSLFHRGAYVSTLVAQLQKIAADVTVNRANGPRETLFLQGLSSISSRLERVSDILQNLDRQADFLSHVAVLYPYRLDEFFNQIFNGIEKIQPALFQQDLSRAIKLGQ
ncbi:MAG: hypothetical protein LBV23_06990, partial [Deltaproteobacteria bacterium]|nr:hypothetical protein [Deltaproteobacteria bacterium]